MILIIKCEVFKTIHLLKLKLWHLLLHLLLILVYFCTLIRLLRTLYIRSWRHKRFLISVKRSFLMLEFLLLLLDVPWSLCHRSRYLRIVTKFAFMINEFINLWSPRCGTMGKDTIVIITVHSIRTHLFAVIAILITDWVRDSTKAWMLLQVVMLVTGRSKTRHLKILLQTSGCARHCILWVSLSRKTGLRIRMGESAWAFLVFSTIFTIPAKRFRFRLNAWTTLMWLILIVIEILTVFHNLIIISKLSKSFFYE